MIVTIGEMSYKFHNKDSLAAFRKREVRVSSPNDLKRLHGSIDAVVFSEGYISKHHKNKQSILSGYITAKEFTPHVFSFESKDKEVDRAFIAFLKGKWFDPATFDVSIVSLGNKEENDTYKGISGILSVLNPGSESLPLVPKTTSSTEGRSEPFKKSDIVMPEYNVGVKYPSVDMPENNYSVIHIKEMDARVPYLTSFLLGFHKYMQDSTKNKTRLVFLLSDNPIEKAKYLSLYEETAQRSVFIDSGTGVHIPENANIVFLFAPNKATIQKLFLNNFYTKYILVDRTRATTGMLVSVKGRWKKVLAFSSLKEAENLINNEDLNISMASSLALISESASDKNVKMPGISSSKSLGYESLVTLKDSSCLMIPFKSPYPVPPEHRVLVYSTPDFVALYKRLEF